MGISLRRRTGGRKPKGNRRSKNRVKEFFKTIVALLVLIILFLVGTIEYDPTGYVKGKKIFTEETKPKIEKVIKVKKVIKWKVRWRTKKVYINRHGHNITAQVEYAKKKFGNNPVALAVFNAESGFEPKVKHTNSNGSVDSGIAQINSCHCRKIQGNCTERLSDYKFNIDFAYRLSNGGRKWSPWVAYKNGSYLRYLNAF